MKAFWINFGYVFAVPVLPFIAVVNGTALCSPDSPLLEIPVLGFFLANPLWFIPVYGLFALVVAKWMTAREQKTHARRA
ncbi:MULTISPECIES: hypothetical protein [Exiguobacterium]|jgi:Na+/phosphate symporter|uniref:Uncharacterized protein n=2 Tax=Exiguobacterium TaxID=33986 RepID=U1M0R0_9BACL|nr:MULTISPECIES: hypothetical protein [Exiguobacterium]ERG68604.1 hypothetical protein M467_15165 [Exiguobacterium chiriqhucha RW-2]KAB2860146.1 MAG: hypothetical protein F9K39_15970 [Exiguobacterium chiriqhucha]MCT4777640.1 hypothetical protein [Exiguobacterium aquaticum]MCT4789730.1 hypothetical protein [Exiguobacterium mexicanum]MDL5377605.1 hypothetical protein [Exiguobacterium mexicanum]